MNYAPRPLFFFHSFFSTSVPYSAKLSRGSAQGEQSRWHRRRTLQYQLFGNTVENFRCWQLVKEEFLFRYFQRLMTIHSHSAYTCVACGHPHWNDDIARFDSVAIVAEYSDGREKTAPHTRILTLYQCQNCKYQNDRFVLRPSRTCFPAALELPDSLQLLHAIEERADLSLSDRIRLRIEAIRLHADMYRHKGRNGRPEFDQLPLAMQENIAELVRILEENQDQLLNDERLCDYAEFRRYLGEFDAARQLLESRPSITSLPRANCILQASKICDRVVQIV